MARAVLDLPDLGPRRATTFVVVNPAAGAQRVSARLLQALTSRRKGLLHVVTRYPGEARIVARRAAEAWAALVVAVGGDGTVHEVANGLRDAGTRTALGVVDCGTGSGFAGSLGLPTPHAAQLALLGAGAVRAVDLGRIRCRTPDGRAVERVFANECQVGIGAAVCASIGRWRRRLGGRFAFGLTSLLTGLGHRAAPLQVRVDGGVPRTRSLLGITIANGERTGGGMRLAPGARLDDGRLDAVLIHDMPLARRIGFLRRVYRGAHVDGVRCTSQQVRRLHVSSAEPVPVAADGEVLGVTPVEIEVRPRSLEVLAPCGGA